MKRFFFSIPALPASVSQETLIQQAADFFQTPIEDIRLCYRDYQQYHQAQRYEEILGERKTLCFEEAFLIYLAVLWMEPEYFVEIGTQYGKSTRRIIDILRFSGNNSCKVLCLDVANEVKYFTPDEAQLEIHDATHDFQEYILERVKPEVIFLDAHPYSLLQNVIQEFLHWSNSSPCLLAIHDCSPVLYKRWMKIKKSDISKISSHTGHWERHVLMKIFRKSDKNLEDVETSCHRLKIFQTPHGLALIMPKNLESRKIR